MGYFTNKVAIVLGCSSEEGIGAATVRALADQGAKLIVAARRFDKVQTLADKVGGYALKCDVSKESDVKALARFAKEKFGRVDIAVNAAGMPTNGTISDIESKSLQSAMEVNFFGNVFFIREMAEVIENDGAIVVFSSMSATHPLDGIVGYACAKAATDCLVNYAALEYGPRNIRINAVLPGLIWSEMAAPFFSAPGIEAVLTKEVPLGRLGKPEEAAETVLWMCGPSYVSGLHIPVAGGQQLNRYPFANEYPTGKESLDAATTKQMERREKLS